MMLPLALAGGALVLYVMHKKSQSGIVNAPDPGTGTSVQGRSGTVYLAVPNLTPMPVQPGTKVTDLYLFPNGTKVMTFGQMGSDKNSRVFLSSPLAPTDPILATAKADWL